VNESPLSGRGFEGIVSVLHGSGTRPGFATGLPEESSDRHVDRGSSYGASAVNMALMSGQAVTVTGTGTCSINPSMETMASIQTGSIR
jgi:hypothetical protein